MPQRLVKYGFALVGISPPESLVQFIVFSTIGSIGMCVDLSCVYLSYDVCGIPFRYARVIGFVIALTNNFILNRKFTFIRFEPRNVIRQYFIFLSVCTVGFLVNWLISVTLYEQTFFFREHYLLASFLGILGGLAINFTGSKYIAFR